MGYKDLFHPFCLVCLPKILQVLAIQSMRVVFKTGGFNFKSKKTFLRCILCLTI